MGTAGVMIQIGARCKVKVKTWTAVGLGEVHITTAARHTYPSSRLTCQPAATVLWHGPTQALGDISVDIGHSFPLQGFLC